MIDSVYWIVKLKKKPRFKIACDKMEKWEAATQILFSSPHSKEASERGPQFFASKPIFQNS
jgi:hypothetical protein